MLNGFVRKVGNVFRFLTALSILMPTLIFAHSGEGINRYVAVDGEDVGDCSRVVRPCKTLGYAAIKAIKGDKVLVASGAYEILDVADLFRIVGAQPPVQGGYNRFDLYLNQNAKENSTLLFGVPREYAQQLEKQGFQIKTDIKFLFDSKRRGKISGMEKVVAELNKENSNVSCSAGRAGIHNCENIDLLSHIPLSSFSVNPTSANDIWGFQSLNDGREYVLIGLRNGVAVIDVSNPSSPAIIDTVVGGDSFWRDIKVLQTYHAETGQWQVHAYITADGSPDKVKIIDLTQLPNRVIELSPLVADRSAHNVYISNVEYSTGVAINGRSPLMHITGSSATYGLRGYNLSNPEVPVLEAIAPSGKARPTDYIHDSSSMISAPGSCIENANGCEIFIDFNEDSVNLWNVENRATPTLLANFIPQTPAYIHSGWSTEDGRYLFVHDELDEYQNLVSKTQVDVFDISDLSAPVYAGAWVGPSNVIDHNGYVRGNRYYVSHYESGLVVLDITDPTSPVRVGYFDTFPSGETNAFHGAWGVYPFLPSGVIAVADVNSGLYLLKNNTLTSNSGAIEFGETGIVVSRGDVASFTVARTNGSSGAISVQYETIYASANSSDLTLNSGTLSWADGDAASKSIDVITMLDLQDNNDTFLVRLYNVQGGAVLGEKNLAKAVLANAGIGIANLALNAVSVDENEGVVSVSVVRKSGAFGELSVQYQTVAGSATANEDYIETSGTLTWADQETAAKIIDVTLIGDSVAEGTESFALRLSGDDALLGLNKEVTVSVSANSSGVTTVPSTAGSSGGGRLGVFFLLVLLGLKYIKAYEN